MPTRKDFGQQGEQIALAYLRSQGYSIVTTNWRCREGEIDIVARQESTDTLVLIEVRTRHADSTEAAFESITPRKQKRLRALAYAYLKANRLDDERVSWRVDMIAIAIPPAGQPVIEHLEDGLAWL